MADGAWPSGEGEMARLVRAHDWAATPLGPAEGWPERLKGVVDLMLASPLVSTLAVGPERVLLYNDAAAPLYGDRHPEALGRPLPETWPEAYATVVHLYEQAFEGRAVQVPAQPLDVSRKGGEVFEAVLAPVRDVDGTVLAVHMTGFEVGARLRAEEMLRESEAWQAFLLRLGDALRAEPDADAVASRATAMLLDRLRLDRCYVATFRMGEDRADITHQVCGEGVPPMAASIRLSDFPAALGITLDRTLVIEDMAGAPGLFETDRRSIAGLGFGALVAPVLRRGEGNPLWTIVAVSASPRRWTPGEVALAEEVAERTWAAAERARAEASLRESEARHRTLFQTMGQGYADIELLRDGTGRAVDQRYLELNPAYERLIGVPVAEAKGRKASEVMPELEPWWTEAFDRIAQAGEPERIEHEVASLGRWYEVNAYPRGGDRLTVLYEDVTARKAAEATLRASEERPAFLLKLSDRLRGESDDRRIEQVALEMLAEHLSADRAYITTSDYGKGETVVPAEVRRSELPPLLGIFRHSEFPESSQAVNEGTMVTADVATDPGLSDLNRRSYEAVRIGAVVGVGLRKGDSDIFWTLAVAMTGPRMWTPDEVLLLEEVAERVLAALARARAEAALRESEERLRAFGEASSDVLWIRDAETLDWTYLSPAFEAIYGMGREAALAGDSYANWLDLVLPDDRAHAEATIGRVLAGERVTFEYRIRRPLDGAVRVMRNTDFPIRDADGRVARIGGVGHDATDERAAEAAVAASEARLRVLTEGIPQLVWTAVDGGHWTWSSPQWTAFTGLGEEASLGLGWLDALHPDDREATLAAWEGAVERGHFEGEYRLRHAATGEHRWFQTRATPVRDEAGAVVEWLGTSTDVEDLRAIQDRQGVLVAELQHRTRNLLGVVRSTMSTTLRGRESLEEFVPAFRDRLDALARVNGLLSRLHGDHRVAFDELIRAELGALGAVDGQGRSERVTLDGPKGVRLRSSTVQTFALALHELATNALKYGALAQPGGHLAVRWCRTRGEDGAADGRADGRAGEHSSGPRLRVEWTETGVAMPEPGAGPQGSGYGRELIERALPYQLGAGTSYELGPDGVRCTITLPLSATMG